MALLWQLHRFSFDPKLHVSSLDMCHLWLVALSVKLLTNYRHDSLSLQSIAKAQGCSHSQLSQYALSSNRHHTPTSAVDKRKCYRNTVHLFICASVCQKLAADHLLCYICRLPCTSFNLSHDWSCDNSVICST